MLHRPLTAPELGADPRPVVDWVETECPLCGADAGAPVLEAPDPLPPPGEGRVFAVVRCGRCGVSYTNPRPSERAIGQFYPPDYRPHRRPSHIRKARPPRPLWARLFGRPCPERRGALPWPGPPGRLLDFGCGTGSFLVTMADQGWQVTGLDSSPEAVARVREAGLPALAGTLPHPDLRPGSFEVVTMWHALEHLHRPLETLREVFRLLVPGGKLVVATPNIDSLPYQLFGPAWFGLDLPRHLTHFTPGTLAAMLRAAGFRPDPVRRLRHSDWLRASATLARRTGRGGLLSAALRWRPAAKLGGLLCYAAGGSDCMVCVAERPS